MKARVASNRLRPFLCELAEGAGKVLLRRFTKAHRVENKRDAGIVTEADKEAERYLLKKISSQFPKSSIITEESGEFRHQGPLLWVLDPLDGTTNFAHGFPWFCVSIGLYEEGTPRAGVIYQPFTRELYYAEAGKGAFRNGKRIRVSAERRLDRSLLGTGFYYARGEKLQREMAVFARLNELARGVRRPGSAALDLACVACGRFDGFWERGLSSWDVAAGFLLVEEAGGKVSDYQGRKTDIFGGEALVTNGRVHLAIARAIQEVDSRAQKNHGAGVGKAMVRLTEQEP